MSDKFIGLKKIPPQPAAKMLAETNTKLATKLSAPPSAAVSVVLEELDAAEAWVDIMRLLAAVLPPREAVWWACLAARDMLGEDEITPCLRGAEAWVFEPTDDVREKLQVVLQNADPNDIGALCATAAFYGAGNMGTSDELKESAAPPSAICGCAFGTNMQSLEDHEDPIGRMQFLIDRALDIARGGNGRIPEPEKAPAEAAESMET